MLILRNEWISHSKSGRYWRKIMKRKLYIFELLFLCCIFLTSCLTTENIDSVNGNAIFTRTKKTREIILDGKLYSAEEVESLGGITSWLCMDRYTSSGDKILLEIGYFTKMPSLGFILYDDTNEGIEKSVWHHRDGLDHRWDWGADENGDYRYSFIIEPDGTGKYYHFLKGETTTKANSFYRTRKR